MSTTDSQYLIIASHTLQIPMYCISIIHVVYYRNAFVNLEEQQRVTGQVGRVYSSTMKMEAVANLELLQDVT